MQVLRNSEEMMEKKLQELKRENKKLVEPLKAYEVECKDLRRRMLNYEKDKQSLAVCLRESIFIFYYNYLLYLNITYIIITLLHS